MTVYTISPHILATLHYQVKRHRNRAFSPPAFSQHARIVGRAMRRGECTASGIASTKWRGIGIKVERNGADDLAVFYDGVERAPMGMVWKKLAVHHALADAKEAYHDNQLE